MPRRLLKLFSKSLSRETATRALTHTFTSEDVVWAIGSFCALNRKPFDTELLIKQFPPTYSADSFICRTWAGVRFIPERMKHKRIWRDVLIAALIIDKVIIHHIQSMLIEISIGLTVFMVFSACFIAEISRLNRNCRGSLCQSQH